MNPTEKITEPNESRKWAILLGVVVVARVVIGVATKEDPFLIIANLFVLFVLGRLAVRAFPRSGGAGGS